MANSDSAFGLKPAMYPNGSPYNGAANLYYVPATDGTAIYIGTPVKLAGSADARGIPDVTVASSTDVVVGVVVAVEPVTNDSLTYRAASTERYVWVADDPSLLFEIQEDSTGGALAVTSVSLNTNWSGSGGATASGLSSVELDSSEVNTTATLDFQIIRMVDRPDNEVGTNANWLVRLNNHQRVDGATGL